MNEELNSREQEILENANRNEEIKLYDEIPEDVEITDENKVEQESAYLKNLGLELFIFPEYLHAVPGNNDILSAYWVRKRNSENEEDNKFIKFSGIICKWHVTTTMCNAINPEGTDVIPYTIVQVFRNDELFYQQQSESAELGDHAQEILNKISLSPFNFNNDDYAKDIKYKKIYFMNQPATIVGFNNDNYDLKITIIPADDSEFFKIYGNEVDSKELEISILDSRIYIPR